MALVASSKWWDAETNRARVQYTSWALEAQIIWHPVYKKWRPKSSVLSEEKAIILLY